MFRGMPAKFMVSCSTTVGGGAGSCMVRSLACMAGNGSSCRSAYTSAGV